MTESEKTKNDLEDLMSSVDGITWSEDKYTVKEIISACKLPLIIKVVDSFLDNVEYDSYATDEILWINEVVVQRRVVMENTSGDYWSVPITNNTKIKRADNAYKEFKKLDEVDIDDEICEWNVILPDISNRGEDFNLSDMRHEIYGCELRVIREHTFTFLAGCCLNSEMSLEKIGKSVVKHHPFQKFSIGIGVSEENPKTWTDLCTELKTFVNRITTNEIILPGITMYSKENSSAKVEQYPEKLSQEKEEANIIKSEETISSTAEKTKTKKKGKKYVKITDNRQLLRRLSEVTIEYGNNKQRTPLEELFQKESKKKNKYEQLQIVSTETSSLENAYLAPMAAAMTESDQLHTKLDATDSASSPQVSDSASSNRNMESPTERQLPQIPPVSLDYDIPTSSTSQNISNEMKDQFYEEIEDNVKLIKNKPICNKNDLPFDLQLLSLEQVSECLKLLHLDKHVDSFKENDIDGIILKALTTTMLVEDLGLTRIEALKLRKFVKQRWLPDAS